jgi:hypothetical protein
VDCEQALVASGFIGKKMTDTCPICQHAKVDAIDAALKMGVAPGIIARRYRLEPLLIGKHVRHQTQAGQAFTEERPVAIAGVLIPGHARAHPQVTENPLSQFKQAWHLAKDDDRMRAQMISWLNEQIQADDMGLP